MKATQFIKKNSLSFVIGTALVFGLIFAGQYTQMNKSLQGFLQLSGYVEPTNAKDLYIDEVVALQNEVFDLDIKMNTDVPVRDLLFRMKPHTGLTVNSCTINTAVINWTSNIKCTIDPQSGIVEFKGQIYGLDITERPIQPGNNIVVATLNITAGSAVTSSPIALDILDTDLVQNLKIVESEVRDFIVTAVDSGNQPIVPADSVSYSVGNGTPNVCEVEVIPSDTTSDVAVYITGLAGQEGNNCVVHDVFADTVSIFSHTYTITAEASFGKVQTGLLNGNPVSNYTISDGSLTIVSTMAMLGDYVTNNLADGINPTPDGNVDLEDLYRLRDHIFYGDPIPSGSVTDFVTTNLDNPPTPNSIKDLEDLYRLRDHIFYGDLLQ